MDPLKRDRSPLPPRAQREIDRLQGVIHSMENRFKEVMAAVVLEGSVTGMVHIIRASNVTAMWNLARTAYAGVEPGTCEWASTTTLLSNRRIVSFCHYCNGPLGGVGGSCANECLGEACVGVPSTAKRGELAA